MIYIQFNGEKVQLAAPISLAAFLLEQKVELGPVAVAVNRQFVPRSCYAQTALASGDSVECVTPMQGG